ncbi:MAG: hypothetical protein BroJett013_09390 [Alphaproteobacteria bacterium]|nr:MAG: hypothetical protein BroJett013_09390 [Alphaproteobacteria bacterium]
MRLRLYQEHNPTSPACTPFRHALAYECGGIRKWRIHPNPFLLTHPRLLKAVVGFGKHPFRSDERSRVAAGIEADGSQNIHQPVEKTLGSVPNISFPAAADQASEYIWSSQTPGWRDDRQHPLKRNDTSVAGFQSPDGVLRNIRRLRQPFEAQSGLPASGCHSINQSPALWKTYPPSVQRGTQPI